MQYLFSVIHDSASLATPTEMAAIDVGEQFLTTRTPGEATFDLGLLVDRLSYEWHSVSKS